MPVVEIHDGVTATGGLTFDLAEILTALGSAADQSSWRSHGVSYVADDDVPEIDRAEREAIPGTELAIAAREVIQVIDGGILGRIQAAFTDVRSRS